MESIKPIVVDPKTDAAVVRPKTPVTQQKTPTTPNSEAFTTDEKDKAFGKIEKNQENIQKFEEEMKRKKEEEEKAKKEELQRKELELFEKQREAKRKLEQQEKEKQELREQQEREEEEKRAQEAKRKEETFKYFELNKRWMSASNEEKEKQIAAIVAQMEIDLNESNFDNVYDRFNENIKICMPLEQVSHCLWVHCEKTDNKDPIEHVKAMIEEAKMVVPNVLIEGLATLLEREKEREEQQNQEKELPKIEVVDTKIGEGQDETKDADNEKVKSPEKEGQMAADGEEKEKQPEEKEKESEKKVEEAAKKEMQPQAKKSSPKDKKSSTNCCSIL